LELADSARNQVSNQESLSGEENIARAEPKDSASRRRKVKDRHAQAGHWKEQPDPMFSSSKVRYEIGANTDAMSYGGIGAMHRLVTKLAC